MPPVRMRGDGRKAKNPRKTLLRLLGYMKLYLPTLGVVLLCIIANAVAQTAGSRSLSGRCQQRLELLPVLLGQSAVMLHFQHHLVRLPVGSYPQIAAPVGGDVMLHRVFHQRQQNQPGYRQRENGIINVLMHPAAFAQP